MPLVTTVIDDKSPLISYDAGWRPGSSTLDDPLASDYYLGTHTVNNVTDSTLTFTFNGTAVWLYGAKRTSHGSFIVQVDSQTFSNLNGEGNNLFQQSLFNTSVSQGMHTVKLTNTATGGLFLDIDMIVWQSEVGNTDDQLVTETAHDTDSRFQYQESAWATTSSDSNLNLNLFNNNSGHITQTYNASVTFTFTVGFLSFGSVPVAHVPQAEAVSLFGTSGPSNGPYSVQLDGGQTLTYNATTIYPTNYAVMLYHADNLGSGLHKIVLTNLPASSGQSLAIDYAQLLTTVNTTADTTSSNGSTSKLSSGAIAGIVIAAVTAVLSAGLALLFYRRWKNTLATHQDLYRVYALQQRGPPELTVPPTGFSSSLETSNASLSRNDISAQPSSGSIQQPADSHGAAGISPGSRDSRSTVDENLWRTLPEAPRGGLSLSAELLTLAGPRRGQNVLTADHSSIIGSEAPPNYTQATGNH